MGAKELEVSVAPQRPLLSGSAFRTVAIVEILKLLPRSQTCVALVGGVGVEIQSPADLKEQILPVDEERGA